MRPAWINKALGAPWFTDLSEHAIVYRRRSHDEDPSDDYKLVMLFDPDGLVGARNAKLFDLVLLTFRFDPSRVRDDRMPYGDAMMEVRHAVDDALPKFFRKAQVRARLIGTQTGNGERTYFIMVADAAIAERALRSVPHPSFLQSDVARRRDVDSLVHKWLRPCLLEEQCAKDDRVREALSARGDDGSTPRDSRFYFYGGDLEGLLENARAQGFQGEPTVRGDGLVLFKDMTVDADALDGVTAILLRWAEAHDSDYDGWECALALN